MLLNYIAIEKWHISKVIISLSSSNYYCNEIWSSVSWAIKCLFFSITINQQNEHGFVTAVWLSLKQINHIKYSKNFPTPRFVCVYMHSYMQRCTVMFLHVCGVQKCVGMNGCGHTCMWKPVIDVGTILSSYLTLDIEAEPLNQTKNSLIRLVLLASLFLGILSPSYEIGITSRSTCQLDICMWTSQDLKACSASMITTDSSH